MTDAEALAEIITEATRVVIFTGAGISTESGIPDFRSPGGVWSKMQPIMFEEFVSSRDKRREAWNRVFSNTARWTGAKPNTGHVAVTQLVLMDKAGMVITQNVDNLHQDAGTPPDKVIELHGNGSYAKCLDCGSAYNFEILKPRWEADEDITCPACGGLIKTATISFGQSMPEEPMRRANKESRDCDLFLVLGSSLVVQPANSFPLIAKECGAELVIVNNEETPLDPYADLVLNTAIGPLMGEVMSILKDKLAN